MTTTATDNQQAVLDEAFERAEKALSVISSYDQKRVDELCQAVAWAVANRQTFQKLVDHAISESGLGEPQSRMGKRMKIRGILRDALRQPSVGVIEEDPSKGIVKYGKPVGVVASIVPTTNPVLTPVNNAIYGIKARDVLIFSPHPRSRETSMETVQIMREALEAEGAPADIVQCLPVSSSEVSQALMARADLVIATGGPGLVKAAYSSGTPAYGVGAGNSTVIIDETADADIAAENTVISKTNDYGSGCSSDGNLLVHSDIHDDLVQELRHRGGYLALGEERDRLESVLWDEEGHRLGATVAVSPEQLATQASFRVPEGTKFIFVLGDGLGREYRYSWEKLTTVLAVHRYEGGIENAVSSLDKIYETSGRGHSCGIYSHSDSAIEYLAMNAPVSRVTVRQPQSQANAGSFTNGMPMTSSLGCGSWGGNITSENVVLKHYMNTTWVSVPIAEDKPSDEELFGRFYQPELED
ncbi:aldehyde dehydrogenase family protein [Brevibacterium sp. FAM 24638]|uniref:aldehyde dehydrogenase family protein n=1 Tax=unclassified Brevibacterium TaxID=2614124 RepID=UPI003C7D5676